MPRNKRESFIYSVIMCFTMVLWMSMYNVTLHMGHLSLETIREGWIGFPFAFVYAFLFDWFIVSGPARLNGRPAASPFLLSEKIFGFPLDRNAKMCIIVLAT